MMKGFSLIELLAVIVVLGIVAAITYPAITDLTKKGEERAYQQQIDNLEDIARKWTSTHLDKVGYDTIYYLTLDELSQDDLIKSKDILNPKTEEPMLGCIEIKWDNAYSQHIVTYLERCPV